jgi:hypothetical protein
MGNSRPLEARRNNITCRMDNPSHAGQKGLYHSYRKYAPADTVLEGLENEAREGRKGLWAYPQPLPPWEWRKR